MKKSLLLTGMAMTAAATIALAACGETGKSGGASLETEDVYGMGAVTTVRLLGSEFSAQAIQGLSSVKALGATFAAEEGAQDGETAGGETADGETAGGAATEDPAISQAEKFNQYFNMLDTMLGEEIVHTQVSENKDEGYAAYTHKMTITGKDIEGNDVTHLMYYTETLVSEEKEEDEEEREYRLTGVMVLDGVEYAMEGGREEEREAGETEDEIYIRAYLNEQDKGTYVQVEQETSVEEGETEKEYVYSIYENGKLIEETAVEFETEREGGKEEAEYELEFRQGESRGKYKVERESYGENAKMKVSYAIDGTYGEFHIRRTTDENGNAVYEYTFENGEIRNLPDERND